MEEDKKEMLNGEEKSDKKRFSHFCHCSLSGHKVMRAVLLGIGIFVIFSIGVGVGSHSNNYRENNYRFLGKGNFEQGGSRMMKGDRFQDRNNGGCPMQENNNQTKGAGCAMQENTNQVQEGRYRMINSVDIQSAPFVPTKTASSTIIK